jgi:hypothetical protein
METKNCPNKARKATQTFNFLASLINGNVDNIALQGFQFELQFF